MYSENSTKGHGIFFYHILKGLRGEAADEHGEINLVSLSKYIGTRVNENAKKWLAIKATARAMNRGVALETLNFQTPEYHGKLEAFPPLIPSESGADPNRVEVARPTLLSDDLTQTQLDARRREWAKYYGARLEYSEDLGGNVKLEMVFIPPGTFWMGTPNKEESREKEETQHEVTITRGFYIGKYEVTQEQYQALMRGNPSYFQQETGAAEVRGMDTKSFPVECVSWEKAQDFLTKTTQRSQINKQNRKYRLPTEAEWEYTCRAGQFSKSTLPFHFAQGPQASLSPSESNSGNAYNGGAKGRVLERTSRVGDYQPNRFGVYDMHGNVWEWCQDWYNEKYYSKSPVRIRKDR